MKKSNFICQITLCTLFKIYSEFLLKKSPEKLKINLDSEKLFLNTKIKYLWNINSIYNKIKLNKYILINNINKR